jgi:hypothetical protein
MITKQNIKDKFLFGIDLLKWNLSIVLYFYLILCLLIKDTEFFYNNYKLMNYLDTPFFVFMAYHFVKHYSKYSKFAQNCAWCMLSVLLIKVQEISGFLSNEVYYNLFWILIVLTALFSVWDNLNFRK